MLLTKYTGSRILWSDNYLKKAEQALEKPALVK